MWYCFLSATSKVFLGWILLINVIAKSSFNEAVALVESGQANASSIGMGFNQTAYCLYLTNFTRGGAD